MKIIDLAPEYENHYFHCLEEWSEEAREAGNHKACWYRQMKEKDLRVKLAQTDNGDIGGMIQYLPAEASFVDGKELYHILCIWVHGHKQGVGNQQKKGMGKALLQAAEDDARERGAKGISAWGVIMPFFMQARWFKKQGYRVVDKDGIMRLLWKQFTEDATPPSFIRQKKRPELIPGKISISFFLNGWCNAQNVVYERTKRAISGFEDYIQVNEYDTTDKNLQKEWGISNAVYIDRKEVRNGPPASYKSIRKIIERKIKAIK